MVWRPNPPDNEFGHVAINTNRYHISLWPQGMVKYHRGDVSVLTGIPASLHFHHDYDKYLEGNRNPVCYTIDYISIRELNSKYEDMLHYNDITPDLVTLDMAEEKISKWIDSGKRKDDINKPEITLKNTLYSFKGGCSICSDFYKFRHSCTTLALGFLINSETDGRLKNGSLFEKMTSPPLYKLFADGVLYVDEFEDKIERSIRKSSGCNLL